MKGCANVSDFAPQSESSLSKSKINKKAPNSGTKYLCNKDASLLLVTDFRNTVIIFLMLFVSEKQKLLFN